MGVIEVFNGVYVSPVRDFEESDAFLLNPRIDNQFLLFAVGLFLPKQCVVTDRLITTPNGCSAQDILKTLSRLIPLENIHPVEILQNPSDRPINKSAINWSEHRVTVDV